MIDSTQLEGGFTICSIMRLVHNFTFFYYSKFYIKVIIAQCSDLASFFFFFSLKQ